MLNLERVKDGLNPRGERAELHMKLSGITSRLDHPLDAAELPGKVPQPVLQLATLHFSRHTSSVERRERGLSRLAAEVPSAVIEAAASKPRQRYIIRSRAR